MCLKDADGIANIVDPEQSDLGLLFAQACLSENLGSLQCEPRHEKTYLCNMQTAKAQISLCIRAV